MRLTLVETGNDYNQDGRGVDAGAVLPLRRHLEDHQCQSQDRSGLDQNAADPSPDVDAFIRPQNTGQSIGKPQKRQERVCQDKLGQVRTPPGSKLSAVLEHDVRRQERACKDQSTQIQTDHNTLSKSCVLAKPCGGRLGSQSILRGQKCASYSCCCRRWG